MLPSYEATVVTFAIHWLCLIFVCASIYVNRLELCSVYVVCCSCPHFLYSNLALVGTKYISTECEYISNILANIFEKTHPFSGKSGCS